jgi:integral membrane protein
VLPGFAVGRALGGPDLSATLGPLHGVVFAGYLVVVLQARPHLGWGGGRTTLIVLAAVVPLGGAIVAHRVMNRAS